MNLESSGPDDISLIRPTIRSKSAANATLPSASRVCLAARALRACTIVLPMIVNFLFSSGNVNVPASTPSALAARSRASALATAATTPSPSVLATSSKLTLPSSSVAASTRYTSPTSSSEKPNVAIAPTIAPNSLASLSPSTVATRPSLLR